MKYKVVYASDGNDLDFLLASIYSVKKFINDVEIYVLSDSLNEKDIKDVKIIDPNDTLKSVGFFSNRWGRRWPYATLYRLAIPLIEDFKDDDKILYLDTDVLVKSQEAANLFEIDAENHEILAAKDSNGTWHRIEKCIRSDLCLDATVNILQKLWSTRKLQGFTYVNAGVALWCVKNIINNGIDWYRQRLKWFWEAETRCKFEYLDQDFINSMMDLNPIINRRFNFFADAIGDDKDIVIKHFISKSKHKFMDEAYKLGYEYIDTSQMKTIVYSSDGNDRDRLRMSMRSVKKFLGGNVRFFILTELEKYPGFEEATLINPAKILKEVGFFPEGWNRKWPYTTLFRLALPLIDEFKDIDKILYLDSDVLFISKKAKEIFNIESNGYEAYGVPDIEGRQGDIERLINFELCNEAKVQMNEKLWKPTSKITKSYINAGVLLEFLNEIRKNGLDWYVQKLKWFWEAVTTGKFTFLDQDFINVMMNVNPSLNIAYNRFFPGEDKLRGCAIVHFVSKTKRSMSYIASKIGV